MSIVRIEELIERLDNLRRTHIRGVAYASGLNLRQLEALIYLARCNRYSDTPLGLTEYLGLTKGTVSQTVITLEDKGFLKKTPDTSDKRVVHLQLTKKGKRVVEKCVNESPLASLEELDSFDKITNPVQENLTSLLTILQRANSSQTFGACETCRHYRKFEFGSQHQCGLTLEPLTSEESLKICREHSV